MNSSFALIFFLLAVRELEGERKGRKWYRYTSFTLLITLAVVYAVRYTKEFI